MRVLLFGTYERDYPRNAIVRSCLRRAGIEIVERHVSVWDGRRHNWSAGAATLARLLAAEARLLALPAARLAARGKPLVFDPLVSLVDTLVDDRARFRRGSLPARALAAAD